MFGFFWTVVEEVKTRTDGKNFLEGKKKRAPKNAVYALDEVIEFCWRTTKKNPEEGEK